MITAPFFIFSTIVSVTTTGDLFDPFKAPIATSHLLSAFIRYFGCRVEVNNGLPAFICKFLNLVKELSNTLTFAPKPNADLVANSPTVPAPIITTSTGGTPLIFPNSIPLLISLFAINSEAIKTDAVPAISLSAFTAG